MRFLGYVAVVMSAAVGGCTSANDATSTSPASTATTAAVATTTTVPTTAVTTTAAPATTAELATTTTEPSTTERATTTTIATPAVSAYTSAIYSDPANWICRPDAGDVCDESFPVANIAADGSVTVEPYTVAANPPVDCFYIYPTSSPDDSFNSDLHPDAEVVVTQVQAAPFNQVCQLYVPVYRSVTTGGLFGTIAGDFPAGWTMAYEDVLDAWRHYLSNDNDGRPVVILAHSQGSFHVVRLLRDEIDPNVAQRDLVVAAMIPGTSFQVAAGSDIGGDTTHMSLCRSADQFGCVMTWQTYRDGDPPEPGALFGRPGDGTDSACTNPAALAGGAGEPASAFRSGDWVSGDAGTRASIGTNRVGFPGLIVTECKVNNGYNYLAASVNADPTDPRIDDIIGDGAPNWGLHTIDVNIVQETLVDLVRSQVAAYLAAH